MVCINGEFLWTLCCWLWTAPYVTSFLFSWVHDMMLTQMSNSFRAVPDWVLTSRLTTGYSGRLPRVSMVWGCVFWMGNSFLYTQTVDVCFPQPLIIRLIWMTKWATWTLSLFTERNCFPNNWNKWLVFSDLVRFVQVAWNIHWFQVERLEDNKYDVTSLTNGKFP